MQAFSKFNRGVKYLLAVIDVFSKYGWLIPLKDKMGKYVASELKTIFIEKKPEKMWVDKGKEFYNKDVKDLIELYSTENEEKKKTFENGYTTRWTEEIFAIVEVKRTSPVTYKIADLNGEEIHGTFYEPKLQKTSQELFRIEKVIKRGKKKSLAKWKGYSDDFNS